MEEMYASVDNIIFDMELALASQLGCLPLPFPGMDKSGAAVCEFYVKTKCSKGDQCPFRHIRGDKSIVCKHWLRGLCKKGDQCEFLHEYDMSKMPECYFYSRFNACHNKECPFLHIDPEAKIQDCPWFQRGFCRHGASCRHRHVRHVLCMNYLAGFCPEGKSCSEAHPRFELPTSNVELDAKTGVAKKMVITCHYCKMPGHKVSSCSSLPPEMRENFQLRESYGSARYGFQKINEIGGRAGLSCGVKPINLNEVTCFLCHEQGHFANKCPQRREHTGFSALDSVSNLNQSMSLQAIPT